MKIEKHKKFKKIETTIILGLISWHSSDPKSVFINGEDEEIEIPCEFLHQLQNLYFALTNEELEINL